MQAPHARQVGFIHTDEPGRRANWVDGLEGYEGFDSEKRSNEGAKRPTDVHHRGYLLRRRPRPTKFVPGTTEG